MSCICITSQKVHSSDKDQRTRNISNAKKNILKSSRNLIPKITFIFYFLKKPVHPPFFIHFILAQR